MKVTHLLLISLLIVGTLFVPAASAEEYPLIDNYYESSSYTIQKGGSTSKMRLDFSELSLRAFDFQRSSGLKNLYVKTGIPTTGVGDVVNWDDWENHQNIAYDVTFYDYTTNTSIGWGDISYDILYDWLGYPDEIQFWIEIDEWDTADLAGNRRVKMIFPSDSPIRILKGYFIYGEAVSTEKPITFCIGDRNFPGMTIYNTQNEWSNYLTINDHEIVLTRMNNASSIIINSQAGNFSDFSVNDKIFPCYPPLTWNVTNPRGKIFTGEYGKELADSGIMRTGTVTMTDHNGTSITGFEVTAVNHYTGEEYTIATDTDVVIMSLPMDRTIEIRNPQTGEYETAPIGYYRFYGQAPGYRMLNEDGIQVAVMPEKYGSYKLCDIGVMSDSGPLTGKHKFQIRSRSDNSILQSGTISAKSATTGEWYNTTVSGGIATLILPYDTSNAMSQYAGNYYVYATSPGYEDSDYGTQIVVMPHTVSEIKTVLLTPIGGVPTPGNVTLRIQAISETGTGVVNAEIFIAGVLGAGRDVWDTYTASSTGYLTVSVPGNSTYDIVASGAGFYDSARRIEVFTDDPGLIEMRLYLSGAPTVEPTDEPTGWPTGPPPTQPPGGIPDDDDDSDGFLVQAVRGIGLAFGVGFSTAKIIFGMLLALAIGFATAKQLRGGAEEFGMGLLGGTMLGVLIGLLPVWIIVVLLLVVGLYIGNRYVGGNNNG